MVAIDLRGHCASEKPTNAESYNNSKVWADDINAVIKAKNLKKPIIVGWSYGGFIISDYVGQHPGHCPISQVDHSRPFAC
jgi:non-heme chloroperoxidase